MGGKVLSEEICPFNPKHAEYDLVSFIIKKISSFDERWRGHGCG
jgi:hypothetical protein